MKSLIKFLRAGCESEKGLHQAYKEFPFRISIYFSKLKSASGLKKNISSNTTFDKVEDEVTLIIELIKL